MKLLYYPDTFLNKKVKDVNIEDPGFDPIELKNEMVELMLASNGIGLSANQVGLDAQVFVMGDSVENSTICINPTILQYTKETVLDIEGCLSFPLLFFKVKRPTGMVIECLDSSGKECTIELVGWNARIAGHEYDHLYGINYVDRVSKLKLDIAKKKQSKLLKRFGAYIK